MKFVGLKIRKTIEVRVIAVNVDANHRKAFESPKEIKKLGQIKQKKENHRI